MLHRGHTKQYKLVRALYDDAVLRGEVREDLLSTTAKYIRDLFPDQQCPRTHDRDTESMIGLCVTFDCPGWKMGESPPIASAGPAPSYRSGRGGLASPNLAPIPHRSIMVLGRQRMHYKGRLCLDVDGPRYFFRGSGSVPLSMRRVGYTYYTKGFADKLVMLLI